jgi:hypothetical protein
MQLSLYIEQLRVKIDRLEKQVALLSAKAGVPMDDPTAGLPPEVVELARSGDRIGAITKYRELLGGDVKTAQDAIATI